jgi:hypothetical protein
MTQPTNRRLVTEAKLATDLGTKVNSSTYTTGIAAKVDTSTYTAGLAAKQDVATLGATVAADATVRAAYVSPGADLRGLLRSVPKTPLHPSPPTVTLGASNAATGLTGTVVSIDGADTRLRFSACTGRTKPAAWYWMGVTPTTSTLDAGAPYCVDFVIDSADFELQLAGQRAGSGYRLWVDGQPLTSTTQAGPGATGGGHRLRLTFASRAVRRIRIMLDCGFCALFYGVTDTVFGSTLPTFGKRAYFLGDSFTIGANAGFGLDGYMYRLSDRLGWEPLCGGEAGTGYTNPGSGGGRTVFPSRVTTDLLPASPDLVVVYGRQRRKRRRLHVQRRSAVARCSATAATASASLPQFPRLPQQIEQRRPDQSAGQPIPLRQPLPSRRDVVHRQDARQVERVSAADLDPVAGRDWEVEPLALPLRLVCVEHDSRVRVVSRLARDSVQTVPIQSPGNWYRPRVPTPYP